MTCKHDAIITWRDDSANPVMWSCMDCGNKFVPLTQEMIDDEALLRIACLAIDKMLPTAFCDEGVEALKQLKERLK